LCGLSCEDCSKPTRLAYFHGENQIPFLKLKIADVSGAMMGQIDAKPCRGGN
jgi:hypothetical protein